MGNGTKNDFHFPNNVACVWTQNKLCGQLKSSPGKLVVLRLRAESEQVKAGGLTTSNPGFQAGGSTLVEKGRRLTTIPRHRQVGANLCLSRLGG